SSSTGAPFQMPQGSSRKSDLPTNHNLPVARAAEKTLYNDFFLHILLNFSLWFRSPNLNVAATHDASSAAASPSPAPSSSASSALDELSAHQVPFVVQFEILLLIKSHVLRNPRYFR